MSLIFSQQDLENEVKVNFEALMFWKGFITGTQVFELHSLKL